MGFPAATRTGDIVLRVERLAKGFDEPLFSDLTFDILRGERPTLVSPKRSAEPSSPMPMKFPQKAPASAGAEKFMFPAAKLTA